MTPDHIARLRLIRTENVGPATYHQLINRFGCAKEALHHMPEMMKRGGKKSNKITSESAALKEIEQIEAIGGKLVFDHQDTYPILLNETQGSPVVLSVLGNCAMLSANNLGIVGARNASANGRSFAQHLARDLGENGYTIVSGLARGIDTAAHNGSLETGTVAVVAGGVDVIYPPENDGLYDQIKEKGCIVSEAPFGTTPQARHFPRRNRIISGLSSGVAVVEAALKSGSLITAHFAAEQGRDVFAVPGSPMDPRCRGTNKLLKEGATLVENGRDIINELSNPQQVLHLHEANSDLFDESTFQDNIYVEPSEQNREELINLLSVHPIGVDELIRQCQLSYSQVSNILLELELAGRIERHMGNKVSLNYIKGAA